MSQPDYGVVTPLLAWTGLGISISPDAALGAVFGGFLFWAMNPEMAAKTKIPLLVGSLGAGYGLGLPMEGSGWSMAFSVLGATLGYAALESVRYTMKPGMDVAPWMIWAKDVISNLTPWRGGSNK